MRDLDSYLMGVFDGEGWISTTFSHRASGRKRLHVRIGVGMNNAEIVKAFRTRFGGGLGHYQSKSGKTMHQWWICSHEAAPFLQLVASHCIEKAEQAKLALQLVGLIMSNAPGGRRARGSTWITDAQQGERDRLVSEITTLKNKPPRRACN